MDKSVDELFQKGMEMMELGEYQVAEQLFAKARNLTVNPKRKQ